MVGKRNKVRSSLRFLLNDSEISLDAITPGDTLLDFLRLDQKLRGTKEGCAEGDCGACTVLVGRLLDGKLTYETVNSCIRLVGSLHGCHVVTIEYLKPKDGSLHPVQQAMVDCHGSQCGFCTPGIVMSLYALWMTNPKPSIAEIEKALQGNLCRCTGYEPIIRAAQTVSKNNSVKSDRLVQERRAVTQKLKAMQDGSCVEIEHDDSILVIPSNLKELAAARKRHPNSTIVAGSTDVGLWVTKFMRPISPAIFVNHLTELQTITKIHDGILIGAGVTYSQLAPILSKELPQLSEFWDRIGGEQVRNMGTVGGNIANGSPIGDTPPVLIALEAKLTLRTGGRKRTIPLEDFFIEYGKQDRREGDFVESLFIPKLGRDEHFSAYKISKRRDEDISSVCGAFRVHVKDGVVSEAVIAFGGMAGTPKRASNVEKSLIGKPWTLETMQQAKRQFDADYTPLTDWRASAEYRALIARNLLERFWRETSGETANIRLSCGEVA